MTASFLLVLAFRMMIVATIVVIAAMVAERSRPVLAALIATLPISIGPTYALLAMEHDAAFMSAAAIKSVASVASTTIFIAVYANSAARMKPIPAVLTAYICWLPTAYFVHIYDWTIPTALFWMIAVMLLSELAMKRFRHIKPSLRMQQRWWDMPLRACAVAILVGFVTGLSHVLGSSGAGTLANFPIVMTSVSLIMHLRMGGIAASAMLSNTVAGMTGVAVALLFVHITIEQLGAPITLSIALLLCFLWNILLYWHSQHRINADRQ